MSAPFLINIKAGLHNIPLLRGRVVSKEFFSCNFRSSNSVEMLRVSSKCTLSAGARGEYSVAGWSSSADSHKNHLLLQVKAPHNLFSQIELQIKSLISSGSCKDIWSLSLLMTGNYFSTIRMEGKRLNRNSARVFTCKAAVFSFMKLFSCTSKHTLQEGSGGFLNASNPLWGPDKWPEAIHQLHELCLKVRNDKVQIWEERLA